MYIFSIKIFMEESCKFFILFHLIDILLDAAFPFGSVSDPDPVGSGPVSGNVDLAPGTKKNCDKLAYKSTKIIKILLFFKRNHRKNQ